MAQVGGWSATQSPLLVQALDSSAWQREQLHQKWYSLCRFLRRSCRFSVVLSYLDSTTRHDTRQRTRHARSLRFWFGGGQGVPVEELVVLLDGLAGDEGGDVARQVRVEGHHVRVAAVVEVARDSVDRRAPHRHLLVHARLQLHSRLRVLVWRATHQRARSIDSVRLQPHQTSVCVGVGDVLTNGHLVLLVPVMVVFTTRAVLVVPVMMVLVVLVVLAAGAVLVVLVMVVLVVLAARAVLVVVMIAAGTVLVVVLMFVVVVVVVVFATGSVLVVVMPTVGTVFMVVVVVAMRVRSLKDVAHDLDPELVELHRHRVEVDGR